MTEDWAAVGRAISARLTELGMKQRELATRSGVSQAIVREIQHNTVQRRRGDRTLEALSTALEWHPQHLLALLHHRKPPAAGQPRENMDDPVTARLTAIEDRLADLVEQVAELRADVAIALKDRNVR
ncbi:XRE family transcriptional regulator [Prauserella coralliicola]|nr:XRE family transcriptional regulator [Prauserella coralliicola]